MIRVIRIGENIGADMHLFDDIFLLYISHNVDVAEVVRFREAVSKSRRAPVMIRFVVLECVRPTTRNISAARIIRVCFVKSCIEQTLDGFV